MMTEGKKLWLWKNGDHYLAFDNAYPCYEGGDPMTLGEPAAIAFFHSSIDGDAILNPSIIAKAALRVFTRGT